MLEPKTSGYPAIRRNGRRIWVALLLIVILVLGSILGISSYVGWNLTHPVRVSLAANPESAGLSYQEVSFKSRVDALTLKGWFIASPGSSKTIIFSHGYNANRLNQQVPILPIAKALQSRGYNVLMFDYRNCGESEGTLTSIGQYEVRDLLGAVDWVKSQGLAGREIVLYGFSMGAATAIMAGAREPAVSAVIADSSFADLKDYLQENLSVWSGLPSFPFNGAFFLVVPLLTGIEPDVVSPVQEITGLKNRPVLLIHGEADVDIPIGNSLALQKACPKAQLLKVPGGTHVKSYQAQPELYLTTVTTFLAQVDRTRP